LEECLEDSGSSEGGFLHVFDGPWKDSYSG
jgi:hypothetical protein